MRFIRNSSGDTIIEVMIVMAIISLVLGGAYTSANQSLNGTRSSQEHAEATKLVEGQLERLRIAAADPASIVYGLVDFCITDTQVVVVNPNNQCHIQPTTNGPIYELSITRPTNGDNETFSAKVEWDRIGGGDKNAAQLVYRVRK